MTEVLGALGLYNATKPLSNTTLETADQTNGYSASWTVPFAARFYIEKLSCNDSKEELVRVLINDRIVPLTQCGGTEDGICTLRNFVDSLRFATSGGLWSECSI
jgi:hypothetical protein